MHNHNETQTLNLDFCFELPFETCFIATMTRVIGGQQAEMKCHYFWLRN